MEIQHPAVSPKIEEIKGNVEKFKEWFSNESKNISEVCKGKDNKENKKIWTLWVRGKKVNKNIFHFYLIMDEPDAKTKLDKKFELIAMRKNGYQIFLKLFDFIK